MDKNDGFQNRNMKYKIVVNESSVKSNHLYIHPQITAERVIPPDKFKHKWFSYSSKKEYYPIVIISAVDPADNAPVELKKMVKMSVKCLESDEEIAPAPFTLESVPLKGIYWFQSLRFHIHGKFLVKFSCNSGDIAPLEYTITVSEGSGSGSEKKVKISADTATTTTSVKRQKTKRSPSSSTSKKRARTTEKKSAVLEPMSEMEVDKDDIPMHWTAAASSPVADESVPIVETAVEEFLPEASSSSIALTLFPPLPEEAEPEVDHPPSEVPASPSLALSSPIQEVSASPIGAVESPLPAAAEAESPIQPAAAVSLSPPPIAAAAPSAIATPPSPEAAASPSPAADEVVVLPTPPPPASPLAPPSPLPVTTAAPPSPPPPPAAVAPPTPPPPAPSTATAESLPPAEVAVEEPRFPTILPGPAQCLPRKSRLDRPLPLSGTGTDSGTVAVQGPLLQLSLPASLVHALLADPLTHRSLCQHLLRSSGGSHGSGAGSSSGSSYHISSSSSKKASRRAAAVVPRTPSALLSPRCSALHLLDSLRHRCWQADPHSQAAVLRLQRLFELLLPTHLLLPVEQRVFAARVDLLQSGRKLLAADFGPYHLLRLLVWVVQEVDGGGGEEGLESERDGGRRDGGDSKGDGDSKRDGESERGQELDRLQGVLHMAVKLLDEQAHVLFY